MASGLAFVNRVHELEALRRLALEGRSNALVVMLRARSGIGKSSIVDRLISIEPALTGVRVGILPGKDTNRLGYLAHVVNTIDEYAWRTGRFIRFQSFISSSNNPAILAEVASRVVSHASAVFSPAALITPLAQRALRADEYNAQAILGKDKAFDLAALTGYLADFMRQPAAMLSIENIQDIDDRSLILLSNAIQQSQTGLWVVEYTDGVDGHAADTLLSRFRGAGAAVKTMYLQPLPWQELRDTLDMRSKPAEALLSLHYSRAGGNLRDFFDAQALIEDGNEQLVANSELSATALILKTLPAASAQAICLLDLHEGCAPLSLMRRAFACIADRGQFAERLDIDRVIDSLSDARIIRHRHDQVEFAHDSVAREVRGLLAFDRYRFIAASAWLSLYRELRANNDPFASAASVATAILYYSFYLGDEAELLATLRGVAEFSIRALAPDRLVAYVRLLFEKIEASGTDDSDRLHTLSHQIIQTLYRVGEIEEAEMLLPFLTQGSAVERYYRIAFATERERIAEALEQASVVLSERRIYPQNPLRLAIALVELVALRTDNRMVECLSRYRSLEESRVFEGTALLPHLDLLSGAALPAQLSVPLLERAVQTFTLQDCEFEANCARISLSQCLGDLGETGRARATLAVIEQSHSSTDAERFTVWTNRAALDLYDGEAASAAELLKTAALVASDPFARLLILTNLLIAHTLQGNVGAGQDVAGLMHGMLEGDNPHEREIRRIAAFNLRFFYDRFDMDAEARKMTALAQTIESQVNQPLWDYRFGRKPVAPSEYAFRMRFDYYPPMFAYWQTDLSKYLANSE